MSDLRAKFFSWEGALFAALILELLIFSVVMPDFFNPIRLLNSTSDFVYFGIVALCLGMIMLTGGIDISFGSIASFAAISMGVTFAVTGSMVLGIFVGVFAGVASGAFNGGLIVLTGAQPMVITLGTQFLFAGTALGVSGLGGVSSFEGISSLPAWFNAIANEKILGLPNMLAIFILISIIFYLLLHHTMFGRQMRLLGVNPRAARYAGFPLARLQIVGYTIMGLSAAIVGILLTSYVGSARADIGASLLMPTLTLVVIGGVSMFGGEGSMSGVVIATFVIGFLQQGLRFSGMSENEVAVVTGTVLIIVASLRWWSGKGTELYRNYRARKLVTLASA